MKPVNVNNGFPKAPNAMWEHVKGPAFFNAVVCNVGVIDFLDYWRTNQYRLLE